LGVPHQSPPTSAMVVVAAGLVAAGVEWQPGPCCAMMRPPLRSTGVMVVHSAACFFSVQTVRRVNRALEEALASGSTPWTALGLHWTPTLDPGIVQHLFQEDLELSGAGLVLGSLHSSAVSQVVDTAVGQVRSNPPPPAHPASSG
jgi:hypothetical protein